MNPKKENQEKDKDQEKKEQVETPIPPQRVDPNKKLAEQDKGGTDRNKKE